MRQLRSDAGDNRDRILVAARLAFTVGGLSVPVKEIARRAQVGSATVYRRFPTKQALYRAAFGEDMVMCSLIVEEGLEAPDPWQGLCLTIEKLVIAHSDDPRVQTVLAQLSRSAEHADAHDRTMRGLAELIRRARVSGALRTDICIDDIVLAVQAGHGVRAGSRQDQVAASRRLAALLTRSFRADPDPAPLPPAVRLPTYG